MGRGKSGKPVWEQFNQKKNKEKEKNKTTTGKREHSSDAGVGGGKTVGRVKICEIMWVLYLKSELEAWVLSIKKKGKRGIFFGFWNRFWDRFKGREELSKEDGKKQKNARIGKG